jgi:hypothetical protein
MSWPYAIGLRLHEAKTSMAGRTSRLAISIFAGLSLFCGCKHTENKPESKPMPAASPQVVRAASTPTLAALPSPGAEATPFLITDSTKWKTLEEFDYQWKADQPTTHFKLEVPEGWNDPGDFLRIHIQLKGRAELVLNNDAWIEYSDEKFPDDFTRLKRQSLVPSKYVLILPHSHKSDVPPLIFLRTWDPVAAGRLHIIGWQASGDPLLLFNDELDLVDVSDVDGDGINEIIGRPCLGEGVGAIGSHAGSYKPYQVYKIDSPIGKTAALSVPLTEQYTRQKYDGWGGPECSNDYVIIEPKDKTKKPLVVSKEAFEKMEKASPPAH